ncbi:MAG: cation:proton antiporter [Candidatus Eremiobacteraeota bacterium]|nr:cation:proton antiporter [Candidatus Eremiobacteraeota bacterium]
MSAAIVVFVVLLGVAFLFARLPGQAGLPPAAAIVLVGIAAGAMLPHALRIGLSPPVLALFLPALIFEAAWDIDASALRRAAVAIVLLAVPGVLLTAATIAGSAAFGAGMAPATAFALGATLSATDPVAVLALFRKLNVPVDLLTIVEGESIANDAVAVVLLGAIIAFSQPGNGMTLFGLVAKSAYVSGAGIVVGLLVGALATLILRRFQRSSVGILTTIAVAYGAYGIASSIGGSGIFASAAAGVALPAVALGKIEQQTVDRFWDRSALIINGIVFLLVGLSLRLERIFDEPVLIGLTVLAAIAARAALAYLLVPLAGRRSASMGWRHAIALAGLRGGLSLALALGLPQSFPGRAQIIDAVFAVVFLTIVVQGWALAPLLRRCQLQGT